VEQLSDHEAEALAVLEGHRVFEVAEGARRVAHLRAGLRSFRRSRARLPPSDRAAVEAARAELNREFGKTRPVAETASIEEALAAAGFTPTEIARLLAAAGLAPAVNHAGPKAPGQRVHDRLVRAKRRAEKL
jgi:hypothetical protein